MGKIIYNGIDCGSSSGGGVDIEPNPTEAATDTLEKLGIDGTVYDFEGTTYTAGTNIQINENVISATDTTYSAFQGTDGTEAGSSGLVPAPAATDTNKYLKSDGTWATVSGGGGSGNVDDVYVNGTSVLDSNHIAQVKSYKELTQAQYDALPASKLTDNILYCIKDIGIDEGDKFAPIIYSLDEREVGTWIDGKPLYQKTAEFNSPISGSTASLSLGIANVDKIFLCADASLVNDMCPLPYVTGTNAGNNIGGFFETTPSDTSFAIRIGSAMVGTISKVIITVVYTKTTDIPGSGSWTTLGVPAVHYTEDEQVIGTYLGKPLYRRVFDVDYTFLAPSSDDWQVTPIQIPDLGNIVDCRMFRLAGGGDYVENKNILEFGRSANDYIQYSRFIAGVNNGITIKRTIVEYTKTTD